MEERLRIFRKINFLNFDKKQDKYENFDTIMSNRGSQNNMRLKKGDTVCFIKKDSQ